MDNVFISNRVEPTHRGAQVTALGEAPGKCEVGQCDCPRGLHPIGEGFVGESKRILNLGLISGGLSRETVNLSNVFKQLPKSISLISEDDKKKAYEELKIELTEHRPNVVLACGNEALRALCGHDGITKWRGSVIESTLVPGLKVIPMLHPAYIVRSFQWQELYIWGEIVRRKLMKEMAFPEVRVKHWENIYMPTANTVGHIVHNIVSKCFRWSIDIETLKKRPLIKCVGVGWRNENEADEAMCIPIQTKMGAHYMPEDELQVWRALKHLADHNPNLVGSNLLFDFDHLLDYNIVPSGLHMDLLLTHNRLYPELPKSVKYMSMMYSDLAFYKDEGVRTQDKDLWAYCIKDCISELRISYELDEEIKRQGKEDVVAEVHHMFPIALEMERLGLSMDMVAYEQAQQEVMDMLDYIQSKRKALTGELNLRSGPQMAKFFYSAEGLNMTAKKKAKTGRVTTDINTVVELMMKQPDKRNVLSLILAEKKLLKAMDYVKVEVTP